MADPSPLDPSALLRELVSQWERGLNDLANRAMASDEFNRGMHGSLGLSLAAQKSLGDLLGRTLTALNLPTRQEIGQLGERLQTIEARLIRIADMLDRAAGSGMLPSAAGGAAASLPKPRRTRQPPTMPAAAPSAQLASAAPASTPDAQASSATASDGQSPSASGERQSAAKDRQPAPRGRQAASKDRQSTATPRAASRRRSQP